MSKNYADLAPALKRLLPDHSLNEAGRAVSFVRRLRRIRASLFVWAVVLSRFGSGIPGFSEARHWYVRLGGSKLWPRPFQMRFKSTTAVHLFERAFETAVGPWRQNPVRSTHPLRKLFPDIVLWDSTQVELAEVLRKVFKGTGKVGAAALKAALAVSAFGLVPIAARLTAGKCNDMLLFPDLTLLKAGTLLLFDKGFVVHERLGEIERAGLHYLCPMRLNGNPIIVAVRNAPKHVRRALKGHPEGVALRSVLPKEKLIGRTWDVDVLLPVARKAKESRPTRTRLVIVPGPQGKQRPYLTTLQSGAWSPAGLKELYRLRWQIELIFKELKQHLNLCSVPSKDSNAVQVFAWASLIALAVSRMVTGWLQPLATLTGLAARYRPMLVSRALRSAVLLLSRILTAPTHYALAYLKLFREELDREARTRETGRKDTFGRLLPLMPTA